MQRIDYIPFDGEAYTLDDETEPTPPSDTDALESYRQTYQSTGADWLDVAYTRIETVN